MHPTPMSTIFSQTKPWCTEQCEEIASRPMNNLVLINEPSAEEKAKDRRKENRGSEIRVTCNNECKASVIDFFDREECLSVSDFVKKHNLPHKFIKYLGKSKTTQRHPPTKAKILQLSSDKKHKN